MKVLVLDTYATYISRRLPEIGVILPSEEECERQLMSYSESDEFRYLIAQHAHDADVIILGNNEGTGSLYLADIPLEKRASTVVVWNNYEPGMEDRYRGWGLGHFCSRRDVCEFVRRFL